ncbi:MAG: LOG family protein [Syntrophothermus sp.]
MNNKKIITVFGSSLPRSGEQQYEDAYRLGELLAQNNFDLCTGGNMGIMEAVSKAAVNNGARAIGITLNGSFGNCNDYLSEHIICNTLPERINRLAGIGDGFLVLQGGTGTLLELASVWEFINKGFLDTKPVVCYGSMWAGIVETIEKQIQLEKRKTGLVRYSDSIEDCVRYLAASMVKSELEK